MAVRVPPSAQVRRGLVGARLRSRPHRDQGHPEHIRSLFTAPPGQVPTLAEESPLRPVLGRGSVLTANGPRHLRQRKLLLPPFHGEAIDRYQQMIAEAVEREIERWPIGRPLSLAPRMQAITLDVIMGGIFGIEGKPKAGTSEHALRLSIRPAALLDAPRRQARGADEHRPRRPGRLDQARTDVPDRSSMR